MDFYFYLTLLASNSIARLLYKLIFFCLFKNKIINDQIEQFFLRWYKTYSLQHLMTNSSSQFCPGSNLVQEIKSFPCFIVKGEEKWSKDFWGIGSFFSSKRNKRKISLFQRNLAWNHHKIYELPRWLKPSFERKTDIRDVVEVMLTQTISCKGWN